VVTQADIDAGSLYNVATENGTNPAGDPIPEGTDDETTTLPQRPAIHLVKTADGSGIGVPAVVGNAITYGFTVTNSGNVTLSDVEVTDSLLGTATGSGSPVTLNWLVAGVHTLAPGESVTGTGAYQITQADLEANHVVNHAGAVGTPPTGPDVTADADSTLTTDTPLGAAPALELTKIADDSAITNPAVLGQAITYTLTVRNTGNQTATNVKVSDPLLGGNVALSGWPGAVGVLPPGQSVTGTGSYPVTQVNLNAGHVANTATAIADGGLQDTDSQDVTLPGGVILGLAKSASTVGVHSPAVAGDVITYTFVVTNTGNQTATSVNVTDPLPGLSALSWTVWPGTAGVLLPGQSATATATYSVKAADIDAGEIVNEATATGKTPSGGDVTPAQDDATVDLEGAPLLTVLKTSSTSGFHSPVQVNDVIGYTITVTNDGNQTATQVTLSDPMFPAVGDMALTWHSLTNGTLRPGEWVGATAAHVVTQADLDAGHVYNQVTATAKDPDGGDVTGTDDEDPLIPQSPRIHLVKTADATAVSSPTVVGDTVTYTFAVSNTGNVTLSDVEVTDSLLATSAGSGSPVTLNWLGAPHTLAPGASMTGSGTYQVTQADL
jgi:uncharacterized repeat protein (TIGR01451 family)